VSFKLLILKAAGSCRYTTLFDHFSITLGLIYAQSCHVDVCTNHTLYIMHV